MIRYSCHTRSCYCFIDRRFYRQRFDAEQTLQAFATTLREEIGLEQLRDHLLSIVHETMKPEHASLWLREVEKNEEKR
jgi:hypothetical protein